jgi:hypothetical protein
MNNKIDKYYIITKCPFCLKQSIMEENKNINICLNCWNQIGKVILHQFNIIDLLHQLDTTKS